MTEIMLKEVLNNSRLSIAGKRLAHLGIKPATSFSQVEPHCFYFCIQVGDGTTSVVLLAGEFLKQAKPYIEEGVHPQVVIGAFRRATLLVCENVFLVLY